MNNSHESLPKPNRSMWQKITQSKHFVYVLISPLAFILLAYVIYPMFKTFSNSVMDEEGSLSLSNYISFFTTEADVESLFNSVFISVVSVVTCGIVGITMAFLLNRYEFPGRRILSVLALVPMALPPLIGAISFDFLYGETGILPRLFEQLFNLEDVPFYLDNMLAIIVVHTFTMYPYFYLSGSATIKGLDMSLEEAATNLGAGRIRIWRKVILPMLTPAMVASSLLVFMISMASYTAPLMFNFERTMTMRIVLSRTNGNLDAAATQSTVLSLVSIGFLLIMTWYQNRRNYQSQSKGVGVHRTEVSSSVIRYLSMLASIICVLILLLPILVIGLISFSVDGEWTTQVIPDSYTLEHYVNLFTDSNTWRPIWNSIKMSSVAVIGNIIFGVAAAYVMVRYNFKGKMLMDILIMVPWALPGTVVAVNLISAFSNGNVFSLNQVLVGTFWILPLAYFVRQLPLIFRNSQASLIQMDESMEEAALGLGASWAYSFRKVVLPAIMPGILAGTLLAFVQGLTEFVASILIYTPSTTPLSVGIWNKLYSFEFGTASAYGTLQTVLIIIVLFINEKIQSDKSSNTMM